VKAKTYNSSDFRYGLYRVWGDLEHSRYFETESQPSVEQIVRGLSTKTEARILAQSFQGLAAIRPLTASDHEILLATAVGLPEEPRARILPEERLEAALLIGDRQSVEALVRDEKPGVAEARRAYQYGSAPTRNRELGRELQRMYGGRCQICLWDPHVGYGRELCHSHHIQWLSRGGRDELENLMLVCPSHHVAIHSCDAPFGYRSGAFDFPFEPERIQINEHLPIWAQAA
jgi:5-methylcytosine-specific restriction enzyme A